MVAAMASDTKQLLSCFLVLFLFLQVFAEQSLENGMGILNGRGVAASLDGISVAPKINCNVACARRCKQASRQNVCARACGTCCVRCQCVPAGTYGNTKSCPCYAGLTTHGKKPKCP